MNKNTYNAQEEFSNEPIELYKLNTLLSRDYPPTEWLVDRLIPESAVVLLSAPPASLKTWFCLDLSLRLASGEKFLNLFNTYQAGVLILDSESGTKQLQKHFKILGAKMDLPIYYRCHLKNIVLTEDYINRLATSCLCEGIRLVIFDSLTRFHNANENDSKEMSKVLEMFSILKSRGISSLVICHTRKGSNDSGQYQNNGYWKIRNLAESVRGSSDIVAACDMHLAIERLDDNVIRVNQTKNRLDEEINPFTARFVKDSNNHSHWEFCETLETKQDVIDRNKAFIYDLITNNPGLNQKQLYQLAQSKNINIGEKSFRSLLKSLGMNKHIHTESGNRTELLYYINNNGDRQNG